MARFVAHVHRELRDQRAALLMVFLTLPVLDLLAFWAFAEHLVDAMAHEVVEVFVPVALLLYVLAVVGDLFAGEARRGTLDFLRRQPGGLAYAFAAKTAVALGGFVAVVLWQCFLLLTLWQLWGAATLPSLVWLLESAASSPFVLGALVLTAWTLLASTWLRQGGLAVLLAPLLLGAIVVPAAVWWRANEVLGRHLVWQLGDWRSLFAWLTIGLGLVALVASAVSFVRGRRVLCSSWSSAWRGLALVLVLSGVAYGGAAAWVDQRTTVTPQSDDFHIWRAFSSPSGDAVWVVAGLRSEHDWRSLVPWRTWRIDATTGRWTSMGAWGEAVELPLPQGVLAWPGNRSSTLEPLPTLVQHRKSDADDRSLSVWLDAERGEVLKVIPSDVEHEQVEAWRREAAARASWLRSASGAPVWRGRHDQGDHPSFSALAIAPGAWVGYDGSLGARGYAVLDVETRTLRSLGDVQMATCHVLSSTHVLRLERPEQGSPRTWMVTDLDTGERSEAVGTPERALPLAALRRDEMLCVGGADARRLLFWNPRTGATRDLHWTGAVVVTAGTADSHVVGRSGAGEACVLVKEDEGSAVVRLEPESGRATTLARGRPTVLEVFALLHDGSAYAIEDGRRIVRYGPEPDTVEIVFPR